MVIVWFNLIFNCIIWTVVVAPPSQPFLIFLIWAYKYLLIDRVECSAAAWSRKQTHFFGDQLLTVGSNCVCSISAVFSPRPFFVPLLLIFFLSVFSVTTCEGQSLRDFFSHVLMKSVSCGGSCQMGHQSLQPPGGWWKNVVCCQSNLGAEQSVGRVRKKPILMGEELIVTLL